LVDEKKITLREASIPKIRSYLHNNPKDMTRVLNHNRRYIFFDWGTGNSPRGSSGVPLTPERSVAIDGDVLPMKTVAFLLTERPVLDEDGNISHWQPMHRFVFPQDTGAAIKGSGRVDLYWGSGDFAEKAAGSMKQQGKLYFLIKNDRGEYK
jgi:membrane-bound lytic murein transglycosylase A